MNRLDLREVFGAPEPRRLSFRVNPEHERGRKQRHQAAVPDADRYLLAVSAAQPVAGHFTQRPHRFVAGYFEAGELQSLVIPAQFAVFNSVEMIERHLAMLT
jgi:hypothetical protein